MLELKPEPFDMQDFQSQTISVCARTFIADRSGALYWPSERALLVADLHFEKGSSFAGRGQHLPPYDTRETLHKLAETIDRYDIDTIIALGDSCHDPEAAERMSDQDLENPSHHAGRLRLALVDRQP